MLVADRIEDPEENERIHQRVEALEEAMSLRQPVDCDCFIPF